MIIVAMSIGSALHQWHKLSDEERLAWLKSARDRYFEEAQRRDLPQAPSGTRFELPGGLITDLTSFLCAMGEAINGPGGYFGLTMQAFDDCCVGGFGATPPFRLRWLDAAASQQALNHTQLAYWAEGRLRSRDYLDDDGKQWLQRTLTEASRGDGPSLFDELVDIMRARHIEIEMA